MAGLNGRAFLLGIEHLDTSSRELFDQHGKSSDGRLALVEDIADEAMRRMIGPEYRLDPLAIERVA